LAVLIAPPIAQVGPPLEARLAPNGGRLEPEPEIAGVNFWKSDPFSLSPSQAPGVSGNV